MTIAIVVKVGDGLVLGADSAATLGGVGGVANVYFNAEKLSNLVKGLPLGMAVFGEIHGGRYRRLRSLQPGSPDRRRTDRRRSDHQARRLPVGSSQAPLFTGTKPPMARTGWRRECSVRTRIDRPATATLVRPLMAAKRALPTLAPQ